MVSIVGVGESDYKWRVNEDQTSFRARFFDSTAPAPFWPLLPRDARFATEGLFLKSALTCSSSTIQAISSPIPIPNFG